MKNLLIAIIAIIAINLTACENKEVKAVKIVNHATEQINAVTEPDEVFTIANEAYDKLLELNLTEEESNALRENPEFSKAMSKLEYAISAKALKMHVGNLSAE